MSTNNGKRTASQIFRDMREAKERATSSPGPRQTVVDPPGDTEWETIVRNAYSPEYSPLSGRYPTGDTLEDARRLGQAAAALDRECENVRNAAEGSRDTVLNDALFSLYRFAMPERGELTKDEIDDAVFAACMQSGDPLPEKQIREKFDRLFKDRASRPRVKQGLRDLDDIQVQFVNTFADPAQTNGNGAAPPPKPPPPPAGGAAASPAPGSLPPSPLEPVMEKIIAAEQDYWDRPSLRQIYDASMMQLTPPHSTLAQCAARAIALVPVRIRLPGYVGSSQGGSPNLFIANVSPSGGGKSTSQGLARELVPSRTDPLWNDTEPRERNLASGEGLVQAYIKKAASKGVPEERYTSILYNVAEIDSLTAEGERSGSKSLSAVREAFGGETLGYAYAKSTNKQHLQAHTYRMVLACAGQPMRYGPLLDDAAGGTPQRFLWFPAFDLRFPDDDIPADFIPQLALPGIGAWPQVGRTVEFPDRVREITRDIRRRSVRGQLSELQAHENFVRMKFALALAVLDGNVEVSEEDWRLAGIAIDVSRIVLAWTIEQLEGADEEKARKLGQHRAAVNDAADEEKARRLTAKQQKIFDQVANWIRGKLAKGEMTKGELYKARDPATRNQFEPVFLALLASGGIEAVPGSNNRKGEPKYRLSKLV